MLAALPMYFPPAGTVDAFWQAFAGLLREHTNAPIPAQLTWPADYHAHWTQDDFLISQTCGYPLTTELFDKVQVLGAFAYDVAGARGVYCTSQLICASTDSRATLAEFQGSTLAFNATDSQSGYNALRAMVATRSEVRPFFAEVLPVGSHAQSIECVRTGKADIAAIDCVTLALWQRAHPALATQIRVFAQSEPYPGLPLVSSLSTPPALMASLRNCLAEIAVNPRFAAVREQLLIGGFAPLELRDYAPCLQMRALASARGLETL